MWRKLATTSMVLHNSTVDNKTHSFSPNSSDVRAFCISVFVSRKMVQKNIWYDIDIASR